MKSEFGILGDGEKHTVTVLVDGFRLFKIENPEIEVTVDKTENVKQIAPGVFEKKNTRRLRYCQSRNQRSV